MKKIQWITLVLCVLTTTVAMSQVTSGFKAGVNFSDIINFDFNDASAVNGAGIEDQLSNNRTGYFLGFLVDIPITENLSFVPEFMYSQQGVDQDDFKIDYLNLPLGLKYSFGGLYINAGPQVGVKIWTPEQSGIFANLEASGFGGIGYVFNNGIFLDARYTIGLTDIFQDNNNFTFDDVDTFTQLEGNNAVIQIGIGYRL